MGKGADNDNESIRAFNRSLPMALLRAREAVMKEFLPSLKEHNISAQQWRVIRALEQQDGIAMSALAERCYLLAPSLSRIVQNLESRQLIERQTEVQDQRRSCIYLTEQGRQLFMLVAPKSEQRYALITEKFGYGKLELLYELLDELVDKIDEDESQSDSNFDR